uniref:ACC1 n=1 Tax=Arundo donax TaxID=35708 RepID=A0A0A9DW43_ARUDO
MIAAPMIHSIKASNLWNVIEGYAHSYCNLGCWQVYFSYPFCHRMFYLQSWIKLQEIVFARFHAVQIFYSSSTDISHALSKPSCCLLKLFNCLRRGNCDWPLLNNLLVPSLDTTISTVQCCHIAMFVTEQLNLQMSALRCHFHNKYR